MSIPSSSGLTLSELPKSGANPFKCKLDAAQECAAVTWPLAAHPPNSQSTFSTRRVTLDPVDGLPGQAVEPIGDFSLKGIRRPLAACNVLAPKTAN